MDRIVVEVPAAFKAAAQRFVLLMELAESARQAALVGPSFAYAEVERAFALGLQGVAVRPARDGAGGDGGRGPAPARRRGAASQGPARHRDLLLARSARARRAMALPAARRARRADGRSGGLADRRVRGHLDARGRKRDGLPDPAGAGSRGRPDGASPRGAALLRRELPSRHAGRGRAVRGASGCHRGRPPRALRGARGGHRDRALARPHGGALRGPAPSRAGAPEGQAQAQGHAKGTARPDRAGVEDGLLREPDAARPGRPCSPDASVRVHARRRPGGGGGGSVGGCRGVARATPGVARGGDLRRGAGDVEPARRGGGAGGGWPSRCGVGWIGGTCWATSARRCGSGTTRRARRRSWRVGRCACGTPRMRRGSSWRSCARGVWSCVRGGWGASSPSQRR